MQLLVAESIGIQTVSGVLVAIVIDLCASVELVVQLRLASPRCGDKFTR